MRRTKEESLETRCRILDAAEVVFFEQGVARTSLADLAAAAGVTRGAIYWHFKNKEDLFSAMLERVKLPMETLFAATFEPLEPDPLGRMRDVLATCLREVAVDPRTHRVFNVLFTKCEYTAEMGLLLERNATAAREVRERLGIGLRNAISKSQLPAALDVTRAAAALHAMISGMLRDWLLDRTSLALPGDAERLADASFDMLRFSPALQTQTTPN
jgi:TetR/AcrR family acrAB operon transcriptional repressor